jgi:hypothetical protein
MSQRLSRLVINAEREGAKDLEVVLPECAMGISLTNRLYAVKLGNAAAKMDVGLKVRTLNGPGVCDSFTPQQL